MSNRSTIAIDYDAHQAANAARQLTGQTLYGFVNAAIWARVDLVEDRFHAARKNGTGAFRSAEAIKRMTVADKEALAAANKKALAAAGIADDD